MLAGGVVTDHAGAAPLALGSGLAIMAIGAAIMVKLRNV